MYRLEAIDFGRRMAVEKQIEQTETAPAAPRPPTPLETAVGAEDR